MDVYNKNIQLFCSVGCSLGFHVKLLQICRRVDDSFLPGPPATTRETDSSAYAVSWESSPDSPRCIKEVALENGGLLGPYYSGSKDVSHAYTNNPTNQYSLCHELSVPTCILGLFSTTMRNHKLDVTTSLVDWEQSVLHIYLFYWSQVCLPGK